MDQTVSLARRVAYAAPAFALAIVGIPVYVYLPKFYTDVVGVRIATVGALLLAVRVFDAFFDPLMGVISDRTRSRYGRRRPWVLGGSVPLALAMVGFFTPPVGDPTVSTIWFGAFLFALFLSSSLVLVPWESLGPQLTYDYNARTGVMGLRDGVLVAGTLAAAASPAVVSWIFGIPDGAAGDRVRYYWVGALYAPLVVALCIWCVAVVREAPHEPADSQERRDISGMWRNRPFIILLVAYTIGALGSNLPATLLLYFCQYVLHSERADLYLVIYLATGIVFLPAWVALSKRIGKKAAWLWGMALNTGAFSLVLLLEPGDVVPFGIIVFFSGIGQGATLALPSSMQADVIDYDELLSKRRREGQYVGVWSVAKKVAAAVGIGVALPILGAVGYRPNAPQPENVVRTLKVLYAVVPCVCNVLAMVIGSFYSIDQRRHAEIRAAIAARAAVLAPALAQDGRAAAVDA